MLGCFAPNTAYINKKLWSLGVSFPGQSGGRVLLLHGCNGIRKEGEAKNHKRDVLQYRKTDPSLSVIARQNKLIDLHCSVQSHANGPKGLMLIPRLPCKVQDHVVKKVKGGVVAVALCGAYIANESCMQLQALTELRLLNRNQLLTTKDHNRA